MFARKVDVTEELIGAAAHAAGRHSDYEPLVELASAAQCVLIGEASHGTMNLMKRALI